MSMRKLVAGAGLALCMALPAPAAAQVLTFEGLQNLEEILDFYNGGTGSLGSSGPNLGIQFGAGALAIIDADDGGSGNFENNPSGSTVAFFLQSNSLFMNIAAGFTTGFSFFYSANGAGSVNVWSGLGATGVLLETLNLASNWQDDCPPFAPGRTGGYCNWDPIGVTFVGTALSVEFAGSADRIAFDNITLGSDVPGAVVPEPATMVLLATGLVGLGAVQMRRRRRA